MESSSFNEQQSLISSFLDVAAGQSEETARKYLQATDWKVDQAISLFYGQEEVSADSDPFKKVTLSNGSANSMAKMEEDEFFGNDLNSMRCHDRRDYNASFPRTKEVSEPKVDKVDDSQDNIDSLYRPPKELMYKGPLHDAKQAAEDQDKWLIVNVQSKKEFSSQTLNLDVWANETVSQTIGANFIFWQVYDDTTEGKKVCDYYNLKSFPAVLVLDPITRHMMRSWTKKIEPERLLEDLVPFMDASPKQHHAQFATTIAPTCSDKNKKLTYPDLPEEPKVDEDETLLCRIEVHFPDGRRHQRNFLRTDPIQFLWSFCSSQLDEAESRPFQLTQAIGGASESVETAVQYLDATDWKLEDTILLFCSPDMCDPLNRDTSYGGSNGAANSTIDAEEQAMSYLEAIDPTGVLQ
ncbi:hypothetical protein MKW98_008368 [Papaver atlanticum]|uniref:UBX domain-containing protein n=1 Tax=Papaver atlanticum TaxID=357466 RepID=A0AAD4XBP5_9MAGN|nr:hypothetical protein MKW98_008368 [Papaver atlanticum]